VYPVIAVGAVVVAAALVAGGWHFSLPLLGLLLAAMLAEMFPVKIESVAAGTTSFATVFIATAATVYDWRYGALVGAGGMLLSHVDPQRWIAPIKVAYNMALYGVAGAAAGAIAGIVPLGLRLGFGGSAVFYLVDVGLLSWVVAATRRQRITTVARSFYTSTAWPFFVMAFVTAIVVHLWQSDPAWSLLVIPPLAAMIVYQTRLGHALDRQRELDGLKDDFLATTSHELRTPLTSIYGAAVTLSERDLEERMQRRLIEIIRTESAHLSDLVDDVLWASRLNSREITQNAEPFDAGDLVESVVTVFEAGVPAGVTLRRTILPDVPAVVADRDHLRRVLMNLVENAVKYSPLGGVVEVDVQTAGGFVRFVVSDDGLGIPLDERERIFEKFVRLDPEMRTGIGGSGLGLYICKRLVEEMHGRIWIEDNGSRGSRFLVDLPAAPQEAPTPVLAAARA